MASLMSITEFDNKILSKMIKGIDDKWMKLLRMNIVYYDYIKTVRAFLEFQFFKEDKYPKAFKLANKLKLLRLIKNAFKRKQR